jgi:class 3 adenylate cyclase
VGRGGKVRAVLWCLCQRYSKHITSDELLALSLLARGAGQAADLLDERLEQEDSNLLSMLTYHFGSERAREVRKAFKADQTDHGPLAIKETTDLIVINMDIRNSTGAAGGDGGREFVELITNYHQSAREKTHKWAGVFDKTIGDGVHLLFNVFHKGLIGNLGLVEDSLVTSLTRSIACLRDIFMDFDKSCFDYQRSGGNPPPLFGLGAALVVGPGRVGSFSAAAGVPGMEYSVLGTVANAAGKIQNWAKRGAGSDDHSLTGWIQKLQNNLRVAGHSVHKIWSFGRNLGDGNPKFYEVTEGSSRDREEFLNELMELLDPENSLGVHMAIVAPGRIKFEASFIPPGFRVFSYPCPTGTPPGIETSKNLYAFVYRDPAAI